MPTKTIVIWDTCGEEPIRFFVVDHDIKHLHNEYFNAADLTEEKQNEMNDLMYSENGDPLVKFLSEFPLDIAREEGTIVIVMGFLP